MFSTQAEIAQALAIAINHHQSGRLAQAEQIYRQILQQQPNHVDVLNLMGVIFCQAGNLLEGINLYRQALSLQPAHVQARDNLGLALWKQGKQSVEEAIFMARQAAVIDANNPEVHFNLATMLREQGKLDDAVTSYLHALAVQPHHVRVLQSLAATLHAQGKLGAAIAYFRQAIAYQPDSAEAHNGLGLVLQDQGEFEAAFACFKRAIALKPDYADAHANHAGLTLTQGELAAGFVEYEWRFQTNNFTPCPFSQPLWDGSPLQGKTILLHGEQGLGDTLQFIRYAPLVADRGGRVRVVCQDPLMPLLAMMPSIHELVGWGKPVGDFHVYAPLLSLPRIFGTTLETIPATIPYLQSPPAQFSLKAPAEARLKVGIVWAGNHQHQKDRQRSLSLAQFEPLLQVPKVAFYSLQKGLPQLELEQLGWQNRVQDLSSSLHTFADTAAVVEQLDLVISVDTSVVHLAGALGKPVWVLLAFLPDWRWMLQRQDSPWYPTARLFRQSQVNDWAGVLERVQAALATMV